MGESGQRAINWLGFVIPILWLLVIVIHDHSRPLNASWAMDSTLPSEKLFSDLNTSLGSLGYSSVKDRTKVEKENYCRWYQEWRLGSGDENSKMVDVTSLCDGTKIWIHHVVYNEYWSDSQLNHYYLLRNQVLPDLMGSPAADLNMATVGHPARNIAIEDLEGFSHEELHDSQKNRLEEWRNGKGLSSEARHVHYHLTKLKRFAIGYGVPLVVGCVVFYGIWQLGRRYRLAVKTRRTIFVVVGTLVFTPAPVPLADWTTLGYLTVTGNILVLLPLYVSVYILYLSLPFSFAIILRLLSLRYIND